jgi:hypothetical protein
VLAILFLGAGATLFAQESLESLGFSLDVIWL